jgi:hypothetical protein
MRGKERHTESDEAADRDRIERDLRAKVAACVPTPVGTRMAEAWLAEARSIYEHRDARLARVESRATTLQGTVSVAVPLSLAAAALILDPAKVEGGGWRVVMAALTLLLISALVLTGWHAARAALKRKPRGVPQGMQDRLKAERDLTPPSDQNELRSFEDERIALHIREQVIDLLAAADRNKKIDETRTAVLVQARASFYLSLVILVVFAVTLAGYAALSNPVSSADAGAKAGATAGAKAGAKAGTEAAKAVTDAASAASRQAGADAGATSGARAGARAGTTAGAAAGRRAASSP